MNCLCRELQYVLPLKSRHLFPQFFTLLDTRKEALSLTGYGLQDVSLEEVFLKVTEEYKKTPNAAAVEAQVNEEQENLSESTTSTYVSLHSLSTILPFPISVKDEHLN